MNNNFLYAIKNRRSFFWENPRFSHLDKVLDTLGIKFEDIVQAQERLERFSPYLANKFKDTETGIIESKIKEVQEFKRALEDKYGIGIKGRVFVKLDNELPIAGSIKARGGIYEVLKFAERVLVEHKVLSLEDDYLEVFQGDRAKDILARYRVVVGSTGNLGLSVGIMAAALGFQAEVHMSYDAREWKKQLLKKWGVKVIEYPADYSYAVAMGRKSCIGDDFAHFVDDENSKDLFLGYAVAGIRLETQLKQMGISPENNRPLCVYLPCGVGGGPGGIAFGIAHKFGKRIRSYVAEPVGAPCVMAALITDKDSINIKELGVNLMTQADGLAVASSSPLATPILKAVLAGGYTITDQEMLWAMKSLKGIEDIKIEPSAGAGIKGVYFTEKYLNFEKDHLIWLTGGRMIPDREFNELLVGAD